MKSSLLIILGSLLLIVTSCTKEADSLESKTFDEGSLEVTSAWARPGKAGMMSAAYLTINNNSSKSDTLLSVRSDISNNAQIHRAYKTADGLMGMQEQPFVFVPSHSVVEFKPGDYHIMIIQPNSDLVEGDSINLELVFSSEVVKQVKAVVQLGN